VCLDRLKSLRRERERYIGSWLPEPVVESGEDEPDDVTLPLLMALERLSPLERAAFLLHDVFGLGFEEVAATIERDPAACRQLATRARAHVRADRPRYPIARERGFEIAEAFFAASRDGEMERLRALLAADVTVYADGGGKASAHGAPVAGLDNVMRLFATFAAVFAEGRSRLVRYGFINGLPGFITIERGDILQTTALEIEDGRVVAVYVVRNPDKLRHVADTVH
jgi:RNA polymerase sigma-70 factor (ECF subfamily)